MLVASSPRINTGYTGLYRTEKWAGTRDKNSNPMPNYTGANLVTWSPEPGVVRHTPFSVGKYGEEEARRMTIDLRKRMEQKIYGQEINHQQSHHISSKKKTHLPGEIGESLQHLNHQTKFSFSPHQQPVTI